MNRWDYVGGLAGAFAGAVVLALWAIDSYHLYSFTYRLGIPTKHYDWGFILLWAVVGGIAGAFAGILAVSLIRYLRRSSN